MSTRVFQCDNVTLCAVLPKPVHHCQILPPRDPHVLQDVYSRIQQFKLTKPVWSDYTEECLGINGTATTTPILITTEAVSITQGETTSILQTVTQTITESVTNVTVIPNLDQGAAKAASSEGFDWVIPVAITIPILLVIAIIFVIYKTCQHAKSLQMFVIFERIVIRKSYTKKDNNTQESYHDLFRAVGYDEITKGDNHEIAKGDMFCRTNGDNIEMSVVNYNKTNGHHTGSTSNPHRTVSIHEDSPLGDGHRNSKVHVVNEAEIPHSVSMTRSRERLVDRDEFIPASNQSPIAVENVSFSDNSDDNSAADDQIPNPSNYGTNNISGIDLPNGHQRKWDQTARDTEGTSLVQGPNVNGGQPCALKLGNQGDLINKNHSDVIRADSYKDVQDEPIHNIPTSLENGTWQEEGIQSPLESDTLSDWLHDALESELEFDYSTGCASVHGDNPPSPGVDYHDVGSGGDHITDQPWPGHGDSVDSDSVCFRHGDDHLSTRSSATTNSRKSDLRTDLENLINEF